MRKLVVTCQCGQRMQVPRSAVGKTGLCPTCGQSITITNDNATSPPPAGAARAGRPLNNARQSWWQGRAAPSEDARRRFGEAVDLFYLGRHAEALAIFDVLAKQFPGNPDIENGRTQCMAALRRPQGMLGGPGASIADGRFDEETVKKVVLDKMLSGANEATQLQAAELAARMLGLFANGRHRNRRESAGEPAPADAEPGNGAPGTAAETEVPAPDP